MRTMVLTGAVLAVLGLTLECLASKPPKNRPDSDIDRLMQQGFGGYPVYPRPVKVILSGKATQKDKDLFLKICVELNKTKPPRGSMEDWQKRTALLVEDARAIAAGGEGEQAALEKLKAHSNCQACHKDFTRTNDK